MYLNQVIDQGELFVVDAIVNRPSVARYQDFKTTYVPKTWYTLTG